MVEIFSELAILMNNNFLVVKKRFHARNLNVFISGVKDEADNWVIGPGKFSTVKYLAGTRIMYDREESQYAETITILGPTTQPLKIMVCHLNKTVLLANNHWY